MKCQKCGANNANTHVKTVINGEIYDVDYTVNVIM